MQQRLLPPKDGVLLVEVSAGTEGDKAGGEDRRVRESMTTSLPGLLWPPRTHKPGHTHTRPPDPTLGSCSLCAGPTHPARAGCHRGPRLPRRRPRAQPPERGRRGSASRPSHCQLPVRQTVLSLEAEVFLERAPVEDQSPFHQETD